MSVELAAAYASVSEQTIRRLIGAGKLTPYRPVSGRVVVDRRQLDALVLSSTGPARSGRGRYPRGRAAS
ncbi:MAG TPA: helix-turn-helix domain-containing protein [Isosphaeraceae bacterium]|nr:helix-turn-helix domain-containing protein [Isosphaeraceae bacterium]